MLPAVAWRDAAGDAALIAGSVAAFLVAIGVVMKSRVGKTIRFVARKLGYEPAWAKFEAAARRANKPQIDAVLAAVAALDTKNDAQHAQNAAAIATLIATSDERHRENTDTIRLLTKGVGHVQESIIEHRTEVNDDLRDIKHTLDHHFGEAARRDDRITALELSNARVRVEIEPTGEAPVTKPDQEEPDDR